MWNSEAQFAALNEKIDKQDDIQSQMLAFMSALSTQQTLLAQQLAMLVGAEKQVSMGVEELVKANNVLAINCQKTMVYLESAMVNLGYLNVTVQ